MAEVEITDLTALTSVDRAADYLEVSDASDSNNSKRSSVNNLLNVTSNPVGINDVQTLTNKTITTPILTINDDSLTIRSNIDTSKELQLQLSELTTAATTTLTIPNIVSGSDTLVTQSAYQVLTNKILTSPTINTATIVNPTLTTDAVNEHTAANGVTVDGLNIKDSKLNTNNSVVTANITDDAVTAAKIDWAATGANGGIWWEELGRTTLGVAGDTIAVSSFGARRYLMVLVSIIDTGGTVGANMTFNSDTGANYAGQYSDDFGARATLTAQTSIAIDQSAVAATLYSTIYVNNFTTDEKMVNVTTTQADADGAASVPNSREAHFKWTNKVSQVTTVSLANDGTGDFAIGSEVVVLGHN